MDNELNRVVIQAVEETFKSITGIEISSSTPVEQRIKENNDGLCVVIGFAGEVSGAFILKCSPELALDLFTKMIGIEADQYNEDCADAIGEIFNMIVGSAKGYYSNTLEKFKISVPTIVKGTNYIVHVKAESGQNVSVIDFNYQDHNFSVEIFKK